MFLEASHGRGGIGLKMTFVLLRETERFAETKTRKLAWAAVCSLETLLASFCFAAKVYACVFVVEHRSRGIRLMRVCAFVDVPLCFDIPSLLRRGVLFAGSAHLSVAAYFFTW